MKKLLSIIHTLKVPFRGFRGFGICLLSFVIFACDTTFPEKDTPMATFTCTVPGGSVQLSGNPIKIVGTTTTTGQTDHNLLCRVTCTDGVIPGGPWVDSIAPLSGAATFQISGLVNKKFDYIYNTLKGSSFRFYERDALAAEITIEIGESYIDTDGSPVEVWNNGDPYEMTVLKGHLTRHEYNILASNNTSFWAYYIVGRRWLTRLDGETSNHYPVINVSSINDAIKAAFAVSANQTVIIGSVTYFSDGTSEIYADPVQHACVPGKLYEIDINKYAYNPNSKTVIRYEVIAADSGALTQRIYYVNVDNRYYENHNIIYFANSVGTIEVMHCLGNCKETLNIDGEVVTADNLSFTTQKHNINVAELKQGTEIEINSGFKSLYERKWMKDMLSSEYVLLQVEDSPLITDHSEVNLLPVYIVPGSYTIDETTDEPQAIIFRVKIAHEY